MYSNELRYLGVGQFDNLESLEEISLSLNRITWIPGDVFKNCTRLKRIYLGGNPLRFLPVGLFKGLVSVEEIFLNYLEIVDLNKSLFHSLPNIKSILLNDNKIKNLHEDTFKPGLFNKKAFVNMVRNPLDDKYKDLIKGQLIERVSF